MDFVDFARINNFDLNIPAPNQYNIKYDFVEESSPKFTIK